MQLLGGYYDEKARTRFFLEHFCLRDYQGKAPQWPQSDVFDLLGKFVIFC